MQLWQPSLWDWEEKLPLPAETLRCNSSSGLEASEQYCIDSTKCMIYAYAARVHSSAEIKLTLSNAGRESYQSDKYGSHIVVLRKLQRDSSSYKIMSEKGVMLILLTVLCVFNYTLLHSGHAMR